MPSVTPVHLYVDAATLTRVRDGRSCQVRVDADFVPCQIGDTLSAVAESVEPLLVNVDAIEEADRGLFPRPGRTLTISAKAALGPGATPFENNGDWTPIDQACRDVSPDGNHECTRPKSHKQAEHHGVDPMFGNKRARWGQGVDPEPCRGCGSLDDGHEAGCATARIERLYQERNHYRDLAMGRAAPSSGVTPPPITHVAVRVNGQVWSLPKPFRHHHIIRMIADLTGATHIDCSESRGDQGFLDASGRYLPRKEALPVALANKQVKNENDIRAERLFSEDVW